MEHDMAGRPVGHGCRRLLCAGGAGNTGGQQLRKVPACPRSTELLKPEKTPSFHGFEFLLQLA